MVKAGEEIGAGRDVAVGQVLTRDDVALDDGAVEVRFRGEMEAAFGG